MASPIPLPRRPAILFDAQAARIEVSLRLNSTIRRPTGAEATLARMEGGARREHARGVAKRAHTATASQGPMM